MLATTQVIPADVFVALHALRMLEAELQARIASLVPPAAPFHRRDPRRPYGAARH